MAINDPVAWYRFNETSGSVATDSGSSGNDMTFSATPTWQAGKIGNGIYLNQNNYGTNNANSISGVNLQTAPWAAAFWAKPDSTSTSGSTDCLIIQDVAQTAGCPQFQWGRPNQTLDITGWGGGGGFYNSAANVFLADVWTHWAFSYDGSGTLTIYKNGTSFTTASGTPPSVTFVKAAVGDWSFGGGEQFKGMLDDMYIFAHALDATDVAALYALGDAKRSSLTTTFCG